MQEGELKNAEGFIHALLPTEALKGKKLNEKLRHATVPFAEIASDALTYSKPNKLSYRRQGVPCKAYEEI